jgi:hypothetical protein
MQTMTRFIKTSALLIVAPLAFIASPASAQASRTWVSGVGDDLNPCSRTAPCKTFAGAISKTAAGGEINCLDPGGFGAFTATKSITIDCTGTMGGILASSTTGVLINAANVNVILRGISINGGPPAITGIHGVRFLQGSSLTLQDVIIQNFNSASAGAGNGITFAPSTAAEIFLNDVTIVHNGGSSTSAGILVAPTGAGVVTGTLNDVRLVNNTGAGISASGNTTLMVTNSTISGNTNFGLRTVSGAPVLRVGNTTITANGTGISLAAGAINSYGTNRLNGNGTDGVFSGAVINQQ